MSNDRALIASARLAFPPSSAAGATVTALCTALERHLARELQRPASDEQALRAEINDNMTTTMLVWADAVADEGNARLAEGIRWLASNGKRPGSFAGRWRWSAEKREFGAGGSWTLPEPLVRAIAAATPNGKGQFSSLAEALLAAAGLLPAYLAWEAAEKRRREESPECDCEEECTCSRPTCCTCGLPKRKDPSARRFAV